MQTNEAIMMKISDDAWNSVYKVYMQQHVLPLLVDTIIDEADADDNKDYDVNLLDDRHVRSIMNKDRLLCILCHVYFFLDYIIEKYLPLISWTIQGSVAIEIHVPPNTDAAHCLQSLEAGRAHYTNRTCKRFYNSRLILNRNGQYVVQFSLQFSPFVPDPYIKSTNTFPIHNVQGFVTPDTRKDCWKCSFIVDGTADSHLVICDKRNCSMVEARHRSHKVRRFSPPHK